MTTVEWRAGRRDGKKRIWLTFPYDQNHKEYLKSSVPGCRWDPKAKLWHFPLDFEVAKDLHKAAKVCNAKLMFEPELNAWLGREKQRYRDLIKPDDLKADVSGWLPHLRATRPDIIEAMERKPWQIPAVAFMVAQRRVLLADKPGLGKTLETIAALLEMDIKGPILIVAPRSAVRVTWPQEIRQWVGSDEKIFIVNAEVKPAERAARIHEAARVADSGERAWVLLGPNYLRIRADVDDYGNFERDAKGKKIIRPVNEAVGEIFGVKWNAVIVDESHLSLAGGSAGVGKRKWSAQRLGLDALRIAPNAPKIAISGTPFRGKTENLWGTLNWVDRPKFGSYWNFIKRHYGVTDTFSPFGSNMVKGDDIVDEKRFYQELAPYLCRRTKEEIQLSLPPDKRLPPKEYAGTHLDPDDPNSPIAVWLPLTPQQRKQYDKVVSSAMLYIDDIAIANVNGALAEMTRFKQIANSCLGSDVGPAMPSNKIDWIVDFLKDRQEAGTKVIVASQFTSFLKLLSSELKRQKLDHYVLTGEQNDKERERVKAGFQSADGDLFVLINTKAGGTSITLDQADDVVICDQTWIPDDQEQVEDRAHRPGGDNLHQVTIWYLASLGTIDEDVAIVNFERRGAITTVLDEVRNSDFVFRMIQMTKDRQAKVA